MKSNLLLMAACVAVALLTVSDAQASTAIASAASLASPSIVPFATVAAALAANRVPRAVRSFSPRANADPATMLRQIHAAFDEFKAANGKALDGKADLASVQAALDAVHSRLGAIGLGVGAGAGLPEDPGYTKAFAEFVRSGERESDIRAANRDGPRRQVLAAMSIGSNSDGGYLAPTEWDRRISASQLPVSPIRRIADVKTTDVNAYSTLWNNRGQGSGWVGETAARPETAAMGFAPITFGHGEIYANPAVTQRLLDDAQMDLEGFLEDELGAEFGRQESIAFVAGNGANKPYGFLTYATGAANAGAHPGGAVPLTTTASNSAITLDEIQTLMMALPAPYRQNSTWVMNSATALKLLTLKDTQGRYLWQPSILAGQPPTLFGRPVEFDENMPSVGSSSIPIAYGDFKAGYLINDRKGLRVLRDPYTNKPYVMFYCTKRVGAGVKDPTALRFLKMAA